MTQATKSQPSPPIPAPVPKPSKLAPRDALAREIQAVLTAELVLPGHRDGIGARYDGHAYAASVAYFHLAREEGRATRPVRRAGDNGHVHWWLTEGEHVIDLTLGPRDRSISYPYAEGAHCAFRGGYARPSKRAVEIIRRVRVRREGGNWRAQP